MPLAILALLWIELIGAGVLTLACRELARFGLVAKLGLSFTLGMMALAVSLFIASLCGITPVWWIGAIDATLLWTLAIGFRRLNLRQWLPRRFVFDHRRSWESGLQLALILFVLSTCLVASATSLLEPLAEWDVLSIHAFKAKVLLHDPISSSPFFHDLSLSYAHRDYPLLWALTLAWVWSLVGHADMDAIKVLTPGLLFAATAMFYGLVRRSNGRTPALLFTALLVALPMVPSKAVRLMSDPALSLFVLGTFVSFYSWVKSPHPDDLRLGSLFATGMLFTKNEGMVWFGSLFLGMCTVALARRKRGELRSLTWVILPLLILSPWFIFRAKIPTVDSDFSSRLDPAIVIGNFSRFPDVIRGWLSFFCDFPDWLAFWPLLFALLALTAKRWIRLPLLFLIVSLALAFCGYSAVFIVAVWEVRELMDGSANRLLLHMAPLCVYLAAELVRAGGLLPGALTLESGTEVCEPAEVASPQ
jgi:hypothetical protein